MTELRQLLRDIEVFQGELPEFDPRTAPGTPVELFTEWLLHALDSGVREPHAMTLSTAGADGNPTARTLILKDVSAQGWQFASDADSAKGRDLADRPFAALTFYWPQSARQVRVRGPRRRRRRRAERRGLPGPWTGGQGGGAARTAEQPADGSRGT